MVDWAYLSTAGCSQLSVHGIHLSLLTWPQAAFCLRSTVWLLVTGSAEHPTILVKHATKKERNQPKKNKVTVWHYLLPLITNYILRFIKKIRNKASKNNYAQTTRIQMQNWPPGGGGGLLIISLNSHPNNKKYIVHDLNFFLPFHAYILTTLDN